MNKRGLQLSVVMLIKVMAVVLVGYLVMNKAVAFAKQETIQKERTTENIAMMVNTFIALPGDALVSFPQNVSKYTFVLTSNTITLFKQGDPEQNYVKRHFFLPKGYTADGFVEKVDFPCLEKKDKQIILRQCYEI